MYYFDLSQRPAKELFDGVTTQTFWGDKMMLSRVVLEEGGAVPPHSHPHEQAGVILEGQLEFTMGGETRVYQAGEMYIIPGHVEHSARAVNGRCVALDVFSPVREEYK